MQRMCSKRAAALAAALLFLFAAHLQPCCRVTLDGQYVPGLYSPAAVRAGFRAARAAVEELLPGGAEHPTLRVGIRLRLRPAEDSAAALSEALLLRTDGVAEADGVRVNGVALGAVSNGEALIEALRETIRAAMPDGAAVGNLGGTLSIRRVYTRSGCEKESAALVTQILRLAPAFYLDENGRLV